MDFENMEFEELLLNSLKEGNRDFVIVNGADRPCFRLIALRLPIEGETGCLYLFNPRYGLMGANRATPVRDFGIEIELRPINNLFIARAELVGESTVKYDNGETREWQEPGGIIWPGVAWFVGVHLISLSPNEQRGIELFLGSN